MKPAVDLRSLRVNRGLGLGEAAKQMGVHPSVLDRAERGENTPHPKNAVRIAGFHGLEVTDIWPVSDTDQVAA